ncbi:hypothetical protein SKAU_G00348420 [Synaphobranchus kaupii]|uniref:Uncharacterized protein n=1 Tax=Synaphobranchus kaupii TaxID=118154 RepID=A0A9Q1EK26_SYNKA|nr:hypothetical protein SKAU_G00348420 [Synaphobranchus kaupii]
MYRINAVANLVSRGLWDLASAGLSKAGSNSSLNGRNAARRGAGGHAELFPSRMIHGKAKRACQERLASRAFTSSNKDHTFSSLFTKPTMTRGDCAPAVRMRCADYTSFCAPFQQDYLMRDG